MTATIVTGDLVMTESSGEVTSLSCTKATNIVAGDLLMIIGVCDSFDETNPWNTLTGWTRQINYGTNSDASIGVWTRIATGDANDKDETISKTGATDDMIAWYMRITGAHATSFWDGAGTGVESTSGTTLGITGYTTTVDDVLVFAVTAMDGSDILPVTYSGTGWGTSPLYEEGNPDKGQTDDDVGAAGSWLTRTVATAGASNTVTATYAASDGKVGIQFGIAPSSGDISASETLTVSSAAAIKAKGDLVAAETVLFSSAADLGQVTNVTQAAFRWGADDGSESAYTFLAAQNVDITQAGTTPAILRYLINTSGDSPSTQYKIQVKRSTGPDSEYRDVPLE